MKIFRILNDLDKYLSTAILFMMVTLVTVQIVMRSVFSVPVIGAEGLDRYFLICIVFLAAPYAARSGGHIRMEEIQSYLPEKIKYTLQVLSCGCAAGVFGLVAAASVITTLNNIGNRTPTLSIPFFISFLPTIIGFHLLTLRYVIILMGLIKNRRNDAGETSA